jgi:uncharacterized protein (TIGR00375 family)
MEEKKENLDLDDFIFTDLHIHSKYSRACSKDLTFENLVKWAKIKGLGLLGTGDFTHPKWLEDIKKLEGEDGIYYYKCIDGSRFPFILSSEISLIYTANGKGRKVHLVYLAPDIETVDKINSFLDSKGRRDYDGRPIFGISARDFTMKMQEINPMIELIPAHIWTPHFGVFGSEGGFDRLSEAFSDKLDFIHSIETGISSDPEMNWKIKELDDMSILSFSDSHSFWPWRLGREATIFNKPKDKLSYNEIIRQIRENDFYGTIETDPAYGKYHFDGHRNCNFSSNYEQTKKLNGICPVCNKHMIIGVEYRVMELAKIGESNHNKKKTYYRLLPLHEIISLAIGIGLNSKATWKIYDNLINEFGNEFKILLNVSQEELLKNTNNSHLTDLIIDNRNGKINVIPGYDGEYGKAVIGKISGEPIKSIIMNESKIGNNKIFRVERQKTLKF